MAIIDPTREPNRTPVARQFATAKTIGEKHILAPKRLPDGSLPMARLTIGAMTDKEERSIRELYNYITRGPLNPRFIFPDRGFVTTTVQQQFWELGNQRVIAFPEIMVAELTGWIGVPFRNSYLHSWLPRAFEKCRTDARKDGPLYIANVLGLVFNRLQPFNVAVLNKADMLPYGYDYYVQLLSVRKRVGIRVAKDLHAELVREPTEIELRNRLQRDFDTRIVPIAFKGWEGRGKRNFMADEELVVSAVITAIMTGQHTMVITRDNDVFDQFTKLFELIVADYFCLRFADVLRYNPNTPMQPTLIEHEEFTITDSVVISRDDMEGLPPYEHTPVHCFCALVGSHCTDPKISIAGYCLEKEMNRLLLTKTETGGKNTSHFPGKNVAGGDWHGEKGHGSLFVRCEEKLRDYEGVSVTYRDLQRALQGIPHIFVNKWLPR